MICALCHGDTLQTYRITDQDGTDEYVCRACRDDVTYCIACGRVPQNPEDISCQS